MNEYYGAPQSQPPVNNGDEPGKGAATGSLVCGIIALVFCIIGIFTLWGALISVVLGIVGLVLAASAKRAGMQGGLQTGGFIVSLLGLVFGAIIFVACAIIIGAILSDPYYYYRYFS